MKKNKAIKREIFPNPSQAKLIRENIMATKRVFNISLKHAIDTYNLTGKSDYLPQGHFTRNNIVKKIVDTEATNYAIRNMKSAYTNFFREIKKGNKHGKPKFKELGSPFGSYKTRHRNFIHYDKLKEGYLKLPKGIGFVKTSFVEKDIPENIVIKEITISYTGPGRYYASLMYEYEFDGAEMKKNNNKAIGLDFSMEHLYVASDSSVGGYKELKEKLDLIYNKINKEKRKRSKMEYQSNNYKKQSTKINKLYNKRDNIMTQFKYDTIKELYNKNDIVCIEGLSIKEMQQNEFGKNFNRCLSGLGWGEFTRCLEYKAVDRRKSLIKLNKYIATSQLCSVCGYKNSEVKDLKVREWDCPECNSHHDRDINAAINIKNEGLKTLSIK